MLLGIFLSIVIAFFIIMEFLSVGSPSDNLLSEYDRLCYLNDMGYSTNDCEMTEHIFTIPEKFNNDLLQYNLLQKRFGYDLQKYGRQTVTVYRYNGIRNRNNESAVATMWILNGRLIGGDISSSEYGGFVTNIKG